LEKNYFKTIDVRNLGEIDIAPILYLLPKLMYEWDKESDFLINPNKKSSLTQVQHINFRWSEKKLDPVKYFDLPLWETYKGVLLSIMQKVVAPYDYDKGYFPRVMLAKMPPGSIIPMHTDGQTRGWIAHKIHIPIITNEEALFFVKDKTYHFEKGKAYEVNNSAMHGAQNKGATARIHLIFEYLNAAINDVPKDDLQADAQLNVNE